MRMFSVNSVVFVGITKSGQHVTISILEIEGAQSPQRAP